MLIGRVEEGRGGLYRIGITPFPFPAHQTGRANFPHPAFRLASSRDTRRGAKMNPAQPKHAEIPEHGPSREPRGAARRHLVTPDQKMPRALIDVIVDRSIGRQARPVAEVERPATQHAVQLVAHLGPGCLVAGPQEPSDLQLEPSHALPGRARPQIPVAILAKALRADTDPRSRRNRANRRGGQLLTLAGSSSNRWACPHLRAPGASVPDGRTIGQTPKKQAGDSGTDILIPVTNPLKRLHGEIEWRTNVVGIFPNEGAITRLIGAILVEQNDEWAVQRARYMTLESITQTSDNVSIKLPAVAARASRPYPPDAA